MSKALDVAHSVRDTGYDAVSITVDSVHHAVMWDVNTARHLSSPHCNAWKGCRGMNSIDMGL